MSTTLEKMKGYTQKSILIFGLVVSIYSDALAQVMTWDEPSKKIEYFQGPKTATYSNVDVTSALEKSLPGVPELQSNRMGAIFYETLSKNGISIDISKPYIVTLSPENNKILIQFTDSDGRIYVCELIINGTSIFPNLIKDVAVPKIQQTNPTRPVTKYVPYAGGNNSVLNKEVYPTDAKKPLIPNLQRKIQELGPTTHPTPTPVNTDINGLQFTDNTNVIPGGGERSVMRALKLGLHESTVNFIIDQREKFNDREGIILQENETIRGARNGSEIILYFRGESIRIDLNEQVKEYEQVLEPTSNEPILPKKSLGHISETNTLYNILLGKGYLSSFINKLAESYESSGFVPLSGEVTRHQDGENIVISFPGFQEYGQSISIAGIIELIITPNGNIYCVLNH